MLEHSRHDSRRDATDVVQLHNEHVAAAVARHGRRGWRIDQAEGGTPVDGLEVHHVVAARDGGATTPENLVTLCGDCHGEIEAEKRQLSSLA